MPQTLGVADRESHRRANIYRSHAHALTEAAAREHERRFQDRRKYLLELAASYRRAANQLAPESPTPIPGQSTVASVLAERGHH
jgi:hypothetical protein